MMPSSSSSFQESFQERTMLEVEDLLDSNNRSNNHNSTASTTVHGTVNNKNNSILSGASPESSTGTSSSTYRSVSNTQQEVVFVRPTVQQQQNNGRQEEEVLDDLWVTNNNHSEQQEDQQIQQHVQSLQNLLLVETFDSSSTTTTAPRTTEEEQRGISVLTRTTETRTSSTALSSSATSSPSSTTGTHSSQNPPTRPPAVVAAAVATISAPWQYDESTIQCYQCTNLFHPFFLRRHHCRLCGHVFCYDCTKKRALIPPSSIVLIPPNVRDKKKNNKDNINTSSASTNLDPDRMLTYITPKATTTSALSTLDSIFYNDDHGIIMDHDTFSTTTSTTTQPLISAPSLDDQQQPPPNNYSHQQEAEVLLYGHGLEERFLLAREPLRVCDSCYQTLLPIQEELRNVNSNAMRYNSIDPTHPIRRFMNSPIAFTLGHEIRKAAYTLNNLLPQQHHQQNRSHHRMGALMIPITTTTITPSSGLDWITGGYTNSNLLDPNYNNNNYHHYPNNNSKQFRQELQQCKDHCSTISPTLNHLDNIHIPASLLAQAKGVAVLTVLKTGFGFMGAEIGTGLVVARQPQQQLSSTSSTCSSTSTTSTRWSAPSAIGIAGLSWGALIGVQVSDHVFLLMTDEAVQMLFANDRSVQLGADIGIAIGPVGRTLEGNVGTTTTAATANSTDPNDEVTMGGTMNHGNRHRGGGGGGGVKLAPIYTYSISKGLYAGISLDGKIISTRKHVNEKFYGYSITAQEILHGQVPIPPAAQPLYEALTRCHVYSSNRSSSTRTSSNTTTTSRQQYHTNHYNTALGHDLSSNQQTQQLSSFTIDVTTVMETGKVGGDPTTSTTARLDLTPNEYAEVMGHISPSYTLSTPLPPRISSQVGSTSSDGVDCIIHPNHPLGEGYESSPFYYHSYPPYDDDHHYDHENLVASRINDSCADIA